MTLTSICAIYTTADTSQPLEAVRIELAQTGDWEELMDSHEQAWDSIWVWGAVEIEGDPDAQGQMNCSLYHLNSIASRHRDNLSINWSQTYAAHRKRTTHHPEQNQPLPGKRRGGAGR